MLPRDRQLVDLLEIRTSEVGRGAYALEGPTSGLGPSQPNFEHKIMGRLRGRMPLFPPNEARWLTFPPLYASMFRPANAGFQLNAAIQFAKTINVI